MTVGKVRKEIATALKTDNKVSVTEARKIVAAAVDGKVTAKEGKLIADLFETGGTKFTPAAKKLLGQFMVDHGLTAPAVDAAAIAKKVLAELGLPNLTVNFDQAEVDRQSKLGGMGFEQALRQSIQSFLTQGDEIDSPLYILQETAEPGTDPKQAVRDYLNRASTSLALVPTKWTEADRAKGIFPPENGEAIADNWVVAMRMPDLSDCLHWAVTDRTGAKPTYNYGFN